MNGVVINTLAVGKSLNDGMNLADAVFRVTETTQEVPNADKREIRHKSRWPEQAPLFQRHIELHKQFIRAVEGSFLTS